MNPLTLRNHFLTIGIQIAENEENVLSFIDLTRSYQRFIGAAINITDLIVEYKEAINSIYKILNANPISSGNRYTADLSS